MKIQCTKQEKEIIINSLMDSEYCPYPEENQSCIYDSGCYDCIKVSIEWEIEDGKQE